MIGERLGHYRIVRSLGRGGMGEVWEAEDTKLGRHVALKLLPREMADDAERLARFEQEARAVAALDHPGIVTVHSIEEADGHRFITMQLVDGQTLSDVIEGTAGQGLPLRRFFDIAIPLAEAVAAAHASGIAHRDLKPANVMITGDGRVKVLDFGLAKVLVASEDDTETVATAAVLTGEGKVLGTVAYMSPEQAEGRKVDERSDIFSLGVILYEMCTGQRPFDGDTQMSILTSIIRDTPPSVTELNRAVPHHLGRIVRHCMEKSPDRRMQSALDVRNELDDLRRELDSGEVPASESAARAPDIEQSSPPRRKPGGLALAAALLVVVAASTAWWLTRESGGGGVSPEALERLTALAGTGDLDALHEALLEAGLEPAMADVAAIASGITGSLRLEVDPPAAIATLRRVTPVDSFAEHASWSESLPASPAPMIAGEYLVSLSAEGFEPTRFTIEIEAQAEVVAARRLVAATEATAGMVHVPAGPSPLDPSVTLPAYLIDATEVTNSAYLEFVSAGGYRDDALWPESLLIDGNLTPLGEARRAFVDRTGIPGPRTWSGGRYPEGQQLHPVTDISWYEAQAYARWRGKQLPDAHQWWRAAVGEDGRVFPWGNDVRTASERANFGLAGTLAVGSLPAGVSPFGCFDMAGNVREWLSGTGNDRRQVAGGSWQDPAYTFDPMFLEAFTPDYTRDSIGLRLVLPPEPEA